MKRKKLPQFRERNHLALHPLLHKGGVHAEDDVEKARERERRAERKRLHKTDWLNSHGL